MLFRSWQVLLNIVLSIELMLSIQFLVDLGSREGEATCKLRPTFGNRVESKTSNMRNPKDTRIIDASTSCPKKTKCKGPCLIAEKDL